MHALVQPPWRNGETFSAGDQRRAGAGGNGARVLYSHVTSRVDSQIKLVLSGSKGIPALSPHWRESARQADGADHTRPWMTVRTAGRDRRRGPGGWLLGGGEREGTARTTTPLLGAQRRRSRAEGRTKGHAEGRAELARALLAARGIEVSARFPACPASPNCPATPSSRPPPPASARPTSASVCSTGSQTAQRAASRFRPLNPRCVRLVPNRDSSRRPGLSAKHADVDGDGTIGAA